MSLKQQVQQTLQSWPPFTGAARLLAAQEGGITLQCRITALDRLACAFESFEMHHPALVGASLEGLKQAAERLAARLSYLLEPIRILEADAEQCVVQLRSSPPEREAEAAAYYELLLNANGTLSLTRYIKQPDAPRQAVPAHVTHEVLLKLTADFAAVA
ncbi:MAG: hypothetical protein K6T59_10305 [Bryobacteraceae bacterium]|nr:hypothetical protein [Bryobacteraceae bacterium]